MNVSSRRWFFGACGLFCALVLIGAYLLVFLASKGLEAQVRLHDATHAAGVKILERDIDNLWDQLKATAREKNVDDGVFNFFLDGKGLQATHTEYPSSPMHIDVQDGLPFRKSLDLIENVGFMVFTKEGALISQLSREGEVRESSFLALSYMKGAYPQDVHFVVSGPKGTTFLSREPGTVEFLTGGQFSRLRISKLSGSNLVVISVTSASAIKNNVVAAAAPLLTLLVIYAGFLGAMLIRHRKNLTAENKEAPEVVRAPRHFVVETPQPQQKPLPLLESRVVGGVPLAQEVRDEDEKKSLITGLFPEE